MTAGNLALLDLMLPYVLRSENLAAGFPGRWPAIRSTVVLVDDVYALVGASHFRRRGMTFDGGVSVASMDRQLDGWGVSASIAAFRQLLVARKLGVDAPAGQAATTAL